MIKKVVCLILFTGLSLWAYDFKELENKLKSLIEKTVIDGETSKGPVPIQLSKEEETEIKNAIFRLNIILLKKDFVEFEKWLGEELIIRDGDGNFYQFTKQQVIEQIRNKQDEMKKRKRIYAVLFKEYTQKKDPGSFQGWIKKVLQLDNWKKDENDENERGFNIAKNLEENTYYSRFLAVSESLIFVIKKDNQNQWKLVRISTDMY